MPFDIPSQPMAAALNAWALQANAQVFVDPGPVAHLRAPAIKGSLTPRQALRGLLAHSNLHVSRGANGVFVIRPRALAAAAAPPAPRPEPEPAPVAAPFVPAPRARASAGPWLLGASAVYASDAGHARSGATLALAAEYFITDHIAGALDVSLPRTHSFEGASARLQSSALRLKYYFRPHSSWDPYLGAGIDVTTLHAAAGVTGLDHVTAGATAAAGVDLRVSPRWLLQAAVSWAQVRPAAGAAPGREIRIDPVQFGLGFIYRF